MYWYHIGYPINLKKKPPWYPCMLEKAWNLSNSASTKSWCYHHHRGDCHFVLAVYVCGLVNVDATSHMSLSCRSMKINGSAPHCTAWSKYQNQRALMLRWQSCCWSRGLATQIQQEYQDFPLDFEEGMREYYSLLVFNFCLFWFFGQKNRLDLIASIHFLYSLSSTLLSFLLKISIVWF